jgi:hypothetical protein
LVIIACHHVAGRTDEKAIWLGLPIDDKELVVDRDLIRDAIGTEEVEAPIDAIGMAFPAGTKRDRVSQIICAERTLACSQYGFNQFS